MAIRPAKTIFLLQLSCGDPLVRYRQHPQRLLRQALGLLLVEEAHGREERHFPVSFPEEPALS
jgi:hypothetical protein